MLRSDIFPYRTKRTMTQHHQETLHVRRVERLRMMWTVTACAIVCVFACATQAASEQVVKHYTVNILRTLPHNPTSFTQGLLYHDGYLYESTGLYGASTLQKIDAATGKVLKNTSVPGVFAEGLARWESRLIQLTWQEHVALIYDMRDFVPQAMFRYDTEGWGLTANERHLIMSDGSSALSFRNPATFATERTIQVTKDGVPLEDINELEWIDGVIYANIWREDFIVQIAPSDGAIIGVIDAAPLYQALPPLDAESVLNGIAYNSTAGTLFLTGKNWPVLFEVTLVPQF